VTSALAARRAAERWFLDRGLPSVVTRRARLRSVWPRSAPALTALAVVAGCALAVFALLGTVDINIDSIGLTTSEYAVLVIVAVCLPLAAIAGWLVARMVTNRSQAITSAVAVAVIAIAETVTTGELGLTATVAVLAAVLLMTASGLGSVIGWAFRLTLSQFAATGALLIRALPVVLLSVLVFFNTYVWVMAAIITQTRMWLAIGLLVAIAAVFVVTGAFEQARPLLIKATASSRHAERLADTPFEHMTEPDEPDPLTRGEWFNVVFVLAVTQIAQILTVSVVTATLFFVLGLIVLSPPLLAAWTRNGASDGTLLGMTLPVPQALIYMTMFLTALTFMYICARAVGDGEYRAKFLDPSLDDLKLTLLARNRYRNNPVPPPQTAP
jgi:hypothetical protein